MQQENEKKEEGISLLDIFKLYIKNKLLAIIIFIISVIVVFLGLKFGVNANKNYYSVEYNLYGLSNGSSLYGDLNYTYMDTVKPASINYVINSNDMYKDINVDDVLKSISITKTLDKNNDDGQPLYTLNISKNAIKDKKVAESFLKDLAKSPVSQMISYINNLDFKIDTTKVDDNSAQAYDTFEDRVSYILTKASLQEEVLKSLYNFYGDVVVNLENTSTTLKQLYSEFELFLQTSGTNMLWQDLLSPTDSSVKVYFTTKEINDSTKFSAAYYSNLASYYGSASTNAKNDKDSYQSQLSAISNTQYTDLELQTEQADKINSLQSKINELSNLIPYYDNLKAINELKNTNAASKGTVSQTFVTKLNDICTNLNTYANTLSAAFTNVINSKTYVIFTSNVSSTVVGGLNTIMIIVVTVILSLIISFAVTVTYAYIKLSKKKKSIQQ